MSKSHGFIPRQVNLILRDTIKQLVSKLVERLLSFCEKMLRKVLRGRYYKKKKLLEKQKKGKKRMKQVGSVEIPQKSFFSGFKIRRLNINYG